jgi:peptide/nickel transport system substrate-binding protein
VLVSASLLGANPKYGGTLVFSFHDPALLNPILQLDFRQVVSLVFDGLIGFDLDGNVVPALAESWSVSDDGLTYTFQLRKDVKWSDGTGFTAADVAFTYNAIKDPSVKSAYASQFASLAAVTADGPYTVSFVLSTPSAPFLGKLWLGILPKHIWEGQDFATSKYNSSPIGTGPWKVEEWVQLDHITFVANETYYRGRPYLDRLVMKVIPDATVAFAAIERGDIDYIAFTGIVGGVPYEQVDRLKTNPNLVVTLYSVPQPQELWFRVNEPPFDNVLVRQAVAHAIDRDYIVEKLLYGYGTVENSHVPSPIGWAYDPYVRGYAYDPKAADALLDQAGYAKGTDGIRFKTTIYGTPGAREVLCQVLKENLRAVGIDATIDISDWTTYMNKVRVERTAHGMWSILAIPALPEPDEGTIYVDSAEIKSGGRNASQYRNARIDELIALGRKETDPGLRRAIYFEYQQILGEELPCLTLYNVTAVDLWSSKFEGFYCTQWGGGSVTSLWRVWQK